VSRILFCTTGGPFRERWLDDDWRRVYVSHRLPFLACPFSVRNTSSAIGRRTVLKATTGRTPRRCC
jgi:hypothetical protein